MHERFMLVLCFRYAPYLAYLAYLAYGPLTCVYVPGALPWAYSCHSSTRPGAGRYDTATLLAILLAFHLVLSCLILLSYKIS